MGKGDRRTRRGKFYLGSDGNWRPHHPKARSNQERLATKKPVGVPMKEKAKEKVKEKAESGAE